MGHKTSRAWDTKNEFCSQVVVPQSLAVAENWVKYRDKAEDDHVGRIRACVEMLGGTRETRGGGKDGATGQSEFVRAAVEARLRRLEHAQDPAVAAALDLWERLGTRLIAGGHAATDAVLAVAGLLDDHPLAAGSILALVETLSAALPRAASPGCPERPRCIDWG